MLGIVVPAGVRGWCVDGWVRRRAAGAAIAVAVALAATAAAMRRGCCLSCNDSLRDPLSIAAASWLGGETGVSEEVDIYI